MNRVRMNNLFASALRPNYEPAQMKMRVRLSHIIENARQTGEAKEHYFEEGDVLTKGQVIILKSLNQTVYLCDQSGWFYWDIDDELNLIRIPKEEESI